MHSALALEVLLAVLLAAVAAAVAIKLVWAASAGKAVAQVAPTAPVSPAPLKTKPDKALAPLVAKALSPLPPRRSNAGSFNAAGEFVEGLSPDIHQGTPLLDDICRSRDSGLVVARQWIQNLFASWCKSNRTRTAAIR